MMSMKTQKESGKVLIVFDNVIEDVETNKNIKQMVAELFSGTRKVKFLVVFI